MASNVGKNPRGTRDSSSTFAFPPFILLVLPLLHPASVLLQPDRPPRVCSSPTGSSCLDRLPLFFFEALDLLPLPLPLFFFRSADCLLPLFFFVSGFIELKFKKLEFHVDELFRLSNPNSTLWGLSLSPNSSFTNSRC